MSKAPTEYSRKLSGEEAEQGYLLVTDDALSLFPPVGKFFKVNVGKRKIDARMEAFDCWCRGTGKPHRHYRISAEYLLRHVPWKRGAAITLRPSENKEYQLTAGE